MAESAVKSSVDLLGKILVEEGKCLWGAEGKVEGLRDELLWMRSFLRKADTIQYKDEIVWMWVSQVQKYVYEAEDIIDKFVIQVVSRRQQNGLLNKLRRYSSIFKELYHLHRAASSIDSLKFKISTLSPKLEKYGLQRSIDTSIDLVEEARTDEIQHILKNVHMEDKKIIGLQQNSEEIIKILVNTKSNNGFHAIYGMGGLGKTTLATKVLKDDVIKQHFSGGQAFVYVSKQFRVASVYQQILEGLNSWSSGDKDPIVLKLQKVLKQKKCLVVVDDVWTERAWDSLKSAFSTCGGDSGSKVLLTTRNGNVAKHVDTEALQKPHLLKDPHDWELLQKTLGWGPKESSATSIQEPKETEIVGNSGGMVS